MQDYRKNLDSTMRMASYDRALKLDPNYQDIWLNRGALLCDFLNRPQEALACFKRAVEIAPDNPLAWFCKTSLSL
jgi:Tfp pilus assembly protein PilF